MGKRLTKKIKLVHARKRLTGKIKRIRTEFVYENDRWFTPNEPMFREEMVYCSLQSNIYHQTSSVYNSLFFINWADEFIRAILECTGDKICQRRTRKTDVRN